MWILTQSHQDPVFRNLPPPLNDPITDADDWNSARDGGRRGKNSIALSLGLAVMEKSTGNGTVG